MAGNAYPQFFGPSYHFADSKASSQTSINCYPKKLDGDNWMMASDPGTVDIVTLSGEGRNYHSVSDRLFVVFGDELLEMAADGTYTLRGSLVTTSGYVGMAHTESQLAIVDGLNLYILNTLTNVFTEVLSAGWRGSNDVKAIDGYFVFVEPDTEQYYISQIDDGTNINALDFNSADANPDNILGFIVNHRQLWFFGDSSAEIHVDSGGAAFPFVRYNSYPIDIGIVGPNAKILAADTIFFVGRTVNGTGVVYMIEGNLPKPISNTAIEEMLLASTDLSLTTMWAYQSKGVEMVGINAPGLDTTLVYDARAQQWHECAEWDDGWLPVRWTFVAPLGTKHFAGDDNGVFCRLDYSINNLSGRELVRERTWDNIVSQGLEPITFYGLELVCATGYGGFITLQISNDSGVTFGPPLIRYLGAIGRWMQRIRWNSLGTSFNRVFRIRQSSDAPFSIYEAAIDT